jgi:CRP/FNR family transcriptional regulator, cyclic AMP receptor protein
LAERYGKRKGSEIDLEIQLSHQDISSIIGSTRESVTNALGELQRLGMLRIARQQIVLTNMKGLAALAVLQAPQVSEASQIEIQKARFLRADVVPPSFSEESL